MNIYALFPLAASVAYIPLLLTTIRSRPWQRQHRLFLLFLLAAMLWSLTDYIFRSSFFPQYNFFLLKAILIIFTWMAVQFHNFTSSFFAPGQGRWLPFAYASLGLVIILIALGYFPEGITVIGDKLYPEYGTGIIFIAIPLLTLAARNLYIFGKRLRILDNPILYNQIISLMIGISVLIIFALIALLPFGRELPVSHFGNLINAFILSYATIRHQLVDVRLVLRRGLAWLVLVIIGAISYLVLLAMLHIILPFVIDPRAIFVAALSAASVAWLVYKLRSLLFVTVSKAFQGESYNYRQKLSDFAANIHKVFSVKEQGAELLALVTKAIGGSQACLLLHELDSEDFVAQLSEPKEIDNPLSSLRLKEDNPIVTYLKRERKSLTRENLSILPEFRSLWEQEKEEFKSKKIEVFVPLISRERLIGILMLDKKQHGRYLLEDFKLLEDICNRVAVSIEKEYLREQLRERERELAIISRSSSIITSSLDIHLTYDSFIKELKKVVDVSWAAIILIEGDEIHFLAISSEVGSAWQVGERISIKGTATEWVAAHRKPIIVPDLTKESRFVTAKYHLERGIRSVIFLPLIVKNLVFGCLAVASCNANAYQQRHTKLLEDLATQIATPIANSLLYAQVEQKARIDALTGLLNRQSLDEVMSNEISRHSRYGGAFSLIILDLDTFKVFNDKYGHPAGDKLLKQIGGTLRSAIRTADQAFRYGGDEFAILLPQTPIDAAYQVAERIRKRITELSTEYHVPVTASLGLASWPANGISPDEVIAAADAALYQAKGNGGNQSQRFTETPSGSGEEKASRQNNEDNEALSNIYALAATVDARDHYTRSHSKKVSEYAVALAEALKLDPLEINRLSNCALLHDIGKIGVNDEILNKTGALTEEEWAAVKTHPQLGATIASRVRPLAPYIPGILHHHERYDGTGYPKQLKGEEIPLEGRILAIADAFAAMTSDRKHAKVLTFEQALEEIKRGAGTQFDPRLIEVFLSVVKTTDAITRQSRR